MTTKSEPAYEGWAVLDEWRPVAGFEGVYEVSGAGQVRRIGQAARTGKGRGGGVRIGRILCPQVHRGGYLAVQLWKDGAYSRRLVHRLVAEAFIGRIGEGLVINHRNGVKTDNTPANLEIVTSAENNLHAYGTGLRRSTAGQTRPSRRKPRVSIECACGCGAALETPDAKGRDRQFITGHNMRRAA